MKVTKFKNLYSLGSRSNLCDLISLNERKYIIKIVTKQYKDNNFYISFNCFLKIIPKLKTRQQNFHTPSDFIKL